MRNEFEMKEKFCSFCGREFWGEDDGGVDWHSISVNSLRNINEK